MSKVLEIYYRDEEVKELYKNAGVMTEESAGFDLVCADDIVISEEIGNDPIFINFGIVVKPPEGFYTQIYSRSSTYKKSRLVLANSVGIIDRDYSGEGDWLMGCFFATELKESGMLKWDSGKRSYKIPAGTRVAQLIMVEAQRFTLKEFTPAKENRGGFGSTGV